MFVSADSKSVGLPSEEHGSSQTLKTCHCQPCASCPSVLCKRPQSLFVPGKGWICFWAKAYLIFGPFCHKMLQVETQPKEICGTILITRAPLLQLHPWLISFSPFKFISNDLYVTKLGQV